MAAFLAGTIRFDRIHSVNARTLARVIPRAGAADSLEALLALDAGARGTRPVPGALVEWPPHDA